MADLNEFQSKIGYTFKNQHLLEQALTHSSYANEKHMKKHSDNERLEFLGDAVLEIVSSEFLFINIYGRIRESRKGSGVEAIPLIFLFLSGLGQIPMHSR